MTVSINASVNFLMLLPKPLLVFFSSCLWQSPLRVAMLRGRLLPQVLLCVELNKILGFPWQRPLLLVSWTLWMMLCLLCPFFKKELKDTRQMI